MKNSLIIVCIATLFWGGMSSAASIIADVGGRAAVSELFVDNQTLDGLQASVEGTGVNAAGSASASASVDAANGIFKFDIIAQRDLANASASAFLSVLETVTVSGSGTLTAILQYDATANNMSNSFTVSTTLTTPFLDSTFGLPQSASLTVDGSASGETGERAVFANAVDEKVDIGFVFSGEAIASAANPFSQLDASNTGTFFLETTGDLTINTSTTGFLAGTGPVDPVDPPDEPSAVPLPAGAWLLLSGLGGAMLFGRRRRS